MIEERCNESAKRMERVKPRATALPQRGVTRSINHKARDAGERTSVNLFLLRNKTSKASVAQRSELENIFATQTQHSPSLVLCGEALVLPTSE
jgi:hypothetical protein